MMTEKEVQQHVSGRMKECVAYVKRQWGNGFQDLGDTLQQALVRAEMLAEISRIPVSGSDPARYQTLVDAMAEAAMRWGA